MEAALKEAYSTPIEVKSRDGSKVLVNPIESIAIRSIQLGMTGKSRENERAIELARKYGPQEEAILAFDLSGLSSVELMLYGYIIRRTTNAPDQLFEAQDLEIYKRIEGALTKIEDEFYGNPAIPRSSGYD